MIEKLRGHFCRRRNVWVILVAIAVMTGLHIAWLHYFSTASYGQIDKGRLDLRDWDVKSKQVLDLNGEWAFYPHTFLIDEHDPSSAVNQPLWLTVPGSWENALGNEKNRTFGYGTYRLSIQLQSGDEQTYAIRTTSVLTASELYINGKYAGGSGQPAALKENYTPLNLPYTVEAAPDEQGFIEVALHVSNYMFAPSGGIELSMQFGEKNTIHNRVRLSETMQQIVFTVFLSHALYAALLYFMGIKKSSLINLSIVLLSLSIALAGNNDKLLFEWFPLSYGWDFRIKGICLAIGGVAAIRGTLPPSDLRWPNVIRRLFTGIGIMLVVYSLFSQQPVSGISYTLFPLFVIACAIIAFYAMLRLHRSGMRRDLFLTLLFASLFNAIIWQYIALFAGINAIFYPIDLLISIFCISAILFKNHLQIAERNKTLAAKLQQEDKLKDEFLAHTSHELRNPLHGILNLSHTVLERDYNVLGNKSIVDLQTVLSIGRRMNILLGDLLDASKLKGTGLQLHKSDVNLFEIIEKTIGSLHFLSDSKPVIVLNEVPARLKPVYADENRLAQILFNLLHNAIKYTPEGEIAVSVQVQNGMAAIAVRDTGIGIAPEKLELLFQPYQQGKIGDHPQGSGFGLGLGICKQLVELHGSSLTVESREGHGSIFRFSLPLVNRQANRNEETRVESDQADYERYVEEGYMVYEEADEGAAKRNSGEAATRISGGHFEKGRKGTVSDGTENIRESSFDTDTADTALLSSPIMEAAKLTAVAREVEEKEARRLAVRDNENPTAILAVDDDPVNLQVISNILAMDKDIEVYTTTSALEALEKLRERRWSLVISDVMMPEMSGYALTSLIRDSFEMHELPVLLLTARNQPEDVEAGLLAGASDYIAKPVNAIELRARVRMLLRLKRSVRERLNLEAAWLQAQIKPHFIMNTLNSIVALSSVDQHKMMQLVEEFSVYLRSSYEMHNTAQEISLSQELKLVKAYLHIQVERFDERLCIQWELDKEPDMTIPPLIIQPLVENAVTHGVLSRNSGGLVRVSIIDKVSTVLFNISDNGIGMSKEQIQLQLSGKGGKGVGLYNTHLRVRQINGKGLTISSQPGDGTAVSFELPRVGR
jgi:sensor histidine kinase YesM